MGKDGHAADNKFISNYDNILHQIQICLELLLKKSSFKKLF